MTREEAIKVIKRMIKTGIAYDDGYAFEPLTKDEEKACGMAIKALEQEVVAENTTSDCVSRDAVVEVMHEMWGESGELLDEIMAIPSVNPQEPKTDILDKLSEEIEASKDCGRAFELGLDMAIKIISKYRQEE